jgi:hypothetical protein
LEDQTIECPHCGDVFSLELTRCPKCGLNMYPEDETLQPYPLSPSGEPHPPSNSPLQGGESGEGLWAVLLGLILAGAVSFVINMFASRAVGQVSIPAQIKIFLFLAAPLGALVGGYSTGVVGKRERLSAAGLGALVGLGSAALAVLFETRWRLVTLQVMLEPLMLAQYALCLLLGALGGWLSGESGAAYLAGAAQPPAKEVKGMSWEDLLYRDLLTRVRFNRDTAERLIEYERRLAPQADRYTLVRNAVERLERDWRE